MQSLKTHNWKAGRIGGGGGGWAAAPSRQANNNFGHVCLCQFVNISVSFWFFPPSWPLTLAHVFGMFYAVVIIWIISFADFLLLDGGGFLGSTRLFFCADVPQVSLKLGHALNASNLKEGDDVYFECQVKANPPPRRIIWKKEVSNIGRAGKMQRMFNKMSWQGSQIA